MVAWSSPASFAALSLVKGEVGRSIVIFRNTFSKKLKLKFHYRFIGMLFFMKVNHLKVSQEINVVLYYIFRGFFQIRVFLRWY